MPKTKGNRKESPHLSPYQRSQKAYQQHNKEIRMVLIGATGAGKSSTGNSLLRRLAFEESNDPQMGTQFSKTETIENIQGYPGVKLSITDTPGMSSTSLHFDKSMVCKQVMQFIGQFAPGPHVIGFVVSAAQRVSREIQETVKALCSMFGKDCTDYIMFIFTKVDSLSTRFNPNPTPIEKWVKELCEQDNIVNELLIKCGGRFEGISNRLPFESDEYEEQYLRIMDTVINIFHKNEGEHLSIDEFDVVENIMQTLDAKTEDRCKSRKKLGNYLIPTTKTAMALTAAAGGLSVLLTGAIIGDGTLAAGLTIAGFSLNSWRIFKSYSKAIAKEVTEEISKKD